MNDLPKQTTLQKEELGKLFNFRPVLFAAFFLVFGIVFAYFQAFYESSPWWVLLPLGVLFALFPLVGFCRKTAKRVAALALCFFMGASVFSLFVADYRRTERDDGYYTVTGRIVEKSLEEDGCKILLDGVALDGVRVRGVLTAYPAEPYASSLRLSDNVQFTAYVQLNKDAFHQYGFRAEAIAEERKFFAGTVKEIVVTGRANDPLLLLRNQITQTVRKGMDPTPAAVTLAVLLGDTTAIDEGLLENVRSGGIAHVFAVSGLHMGSLFAVCAALMKKTKAKYLPAPVRFLLVAAVLCFYGGICGYSASVLRAIVTCLALYLYKLLGAKSDGLENLSFAAFAVLLFQPTQLFAVGFQLSFASCYGIALLSRPLREAFEGGIAWIERTVRRSFKRPEKAPIDMFVADTPPPGLYEQGKKAVVGFVAVSLAAQLATAPILLVSFGYLSNAGVLLNALFVPLLSVCFCPLLFFVFAAVAVAAAESLLLFLPNLIVSALMLFFQTVDITSAVTKGISLSAGGIATYYLALLFCSDKFNLKRKWKALAAGCFFLAFAVATAAYNL